MSSADPTSQKDPSTGELVAQMTEQVSTLVRDEIRLAKADLAATGKGVGIGAGLFGAAGVLALYGLGALIATIILAIAQGLAPWLSALIVTVALFAAAGVAALIGKGQVGKATALPGARVESIKTDVDTAKGNSHG